MGFFGSTIGRVGAGMATGGLSEIYRALNPGSGGSSGYSPLPFDYGEGNQVDASKVAQALQQGLGRYPTKSEIDQYTKYIRTGDLTYADVGNIAASMPEADKARLEQYAKQFQDTLGAQDESILNRAAAAANSQFAGMGRPVTSAQTASVLQAGNALAQQRQSALANFYGQGLQQNRAAYQDVGQSALQRGYNLSDSRTAFNRGLLGYQTQRNDYGVDLATQEAKNRRQAFGQLLGGVAGAGIGSIGGVQGARLGAGIGSNAGGLFY